MLAAGGGTCSYCRRETSELAVCAVCRRRLCPACHRGLGCQRGTCGGSSPAVRR